jgi:hypothetical protein
MIKWIKINEICKQSGISMNFIIKVDKWCLRVVVIIVGINWVLTWISSWILRGTSKIGGAHIAEAPSRFLSFLLFYFRSVFV